MWSTSVEEDAAGRGNPVALGRLYAVCWLAPAGCRKKGDLHLEDKDRQGPGVKPGVPYLSNALEGLIILETPTMKRKPKSRHQTHNEKSD